MLAKSPVSVLAGVYLEWSEGEIPAKAVSVYGTSGAAQADLGEVAESLEATHGIEIADVVWWGDNDEAERQASETMAEQGETARTPRPEGDDAADVWKSVPLAEFAGSLGLRSAFSGSPSDTSSGSQTSQEERQI